MRLLLIDTETTGLDPKVDRLIEVGWVSYDADVGAIVECRSVVVRAAEYLEANITGIPPAVVLSGRDVDIVVAAAQRVADRHDFILAHNAEFDSGFLPLSGRWLCTCHDADWPRSHRSSPNLTGLALAYGLGVARAHRAIDDCLTLAAILTRVHELEGGLGDWLARATEPRVSIAATVSYHDRQLAKDAGFGWDGDAKIWQKRVRVSQLEALRAELPFKTRELRTA